MGKMSGRPGEGEYGIFDRVKDHSRKRQRR